jgi:transketolase
MSAADLLAVLMSKYLSYDFDEPKNPNNGHAAPGATARHLSRPT